ncbi:MAG: hypothetical protein ACI9K2_003318, partial [Myxococcota bacterium]
KEEKKKATKAVGEGVVDALLEGAVETANDLTHWRNERDENRFRRLSDDAIEGSASETE